MALGKTVRELLTGIPGLTRKELTEWVAFYNLEPFGEYAANLQAGNIASPLLNALTGKRTKPTDWVAELEPSKPQPPELMKKILEAAAKVGQRKTRPGMKPFQKSKPSRRRK